MDISVLRLYILQTSSIVEVLEEIIFTIFLHYGERSFSPDSPPSSNMERSISSSSSSMERTISPPYSFVEKVFKSSALIALRAQRFVHSPIMAEELVKINILLVVLDSQKLLKSTTSEAHSMEFRDIFKDILLSILYV